MKVVSRILAMAAAIAMTILPVTSSWAADDAMSQQLNRHVRQGDVVALTQAQALKLKATHPALYKMLVEEGVAALPKLKRSERQMLAAMTSITLRELKAGQVPNVVVNAPATPAVTKDSLSLVAACVVVAGGFAAIPVAGIFLAIGAGVVCLLMLINPNWFNLFGLRAQS